LAAATGQHAMFDRLAVQIETAAHNQFTTELPLGLAHGDFAMRNVLVRSGDTVFVLDTAATSLAPVYADLAKFSLAMRVSRAQVYSQGAAFNEKNLRIADKWLLQGYYGDAPAPEEQIRLYGLLLLLDKWSFEHALLSGRTSLSDEIKRRLLLSWFKRLAGSMVESLY
jgi:aminoglycoside phosphotransferase (APT) family kinase protein